MATQKQHCVYLKQLALFSSQRKIHPHSPGLRRVLEFLSIQLHLSFWALNTARSAFLCVLRGENIPAGGHPVVFRFLKVAFESKPLSNRYYDIWDVQEVLRFLKTFSPYYL